MLISVYLFSDAEKNANEEAEQAGFAEMEEEAA